MSGVKGRSGRVPGYHGRVVRAMAIFEKSLPELADKLMERAKAGDKDCLMYVFDRILGKPRQEIDQRVRGIIMTVSADEIAQLVLQTQAEQRRMLEPIHSTSSGQVIEAEVVEPPTIEANNDATQP